MFINFRERGRERGTKKKHGYEKHWWVVSHMGPDQGSNLQSRYVSGPGIKPTTFLCTGQHSNQLSNPAKTLLFPVVSFFLFIASAILHSSAALLQPVGAIFVISFCYQYLPEGNIYTHLMSWVLCLVTMFLQLLHRDCPLIAGLWWPRWFAFLVHGTVIIVKSVFAWNTTTKWTLHRQLTYTYPRHFQKGIFSSLGNLILEGFWSGTTIRDYRSAVTKQKSVDKIFVLSLCLIIARSLVSSRKEFMILTDALIFAAAREHLHITSCSGNQLCLHSQVPYDCNQMWKCMNSCH